MNLSDDKKSPFVRPLTPESSIFATMPANYSLLSQNQQRIWQLGKAPDNNHHQIMQMLWRVGDHCRLDIVEQAFALVIKQFPILTCQVIEHDGLAYYRCQENYSGQIIQSTAVSPIAFEKIDLSHLNQQEVDGYLRHQLQQGFNDTDKFLLKPFMLQLSNNQTMILIQIHRLLMDENAYRLFNRWLWRFYSQLLPVPILSGQAGAVPEQAFSFEQCQQIEVTPQYSFRDLNQWEQQMLHSDLGESHLAYWRQALGGAIPLVGLPNDSHRIHGSGGFASHQVTLVQGVTRRLINFKQLNSVKTSVVLLAAFKVLLYRYTGQTDIVVGTPTKGPSLRMNEDFGQFGNILPMRSRMSDALTFKLLIEQLAQTVEAAAAHGDYPLMSLVQDAVVGCYAPFAAFFQLTFNYHIEKSIAPRLSQFDVLDTDLQQNLQQDIAIDIFKGNDNYTMQVRYDTKKYLPQTIERLAEHFIVLLDNLISCPQHAIASVSCMSKSQLQQIQLGFNYTQQELPSPTNFSALLQQQVEINPHGQALICDGSGVSYEQFNIRVNQLADELLFYGIEYRTNVAICLPRSIDLIIAIFATLKAGAAFALIDPQASKNTKAHILEDCKAKLLLTNCGLQIDLPEVKCRQFLLDQNRAKLALSQQNEPLLKREIRPDDLCQILYQDQLRDPTPVGIKINHHNLVNLAFTFSEYEKVTPQRGFWAWQYVFDGRQSALALGQLVLGHGCFLLSDRVCEDNQVQARFMMDSNISCYQAKAAKVIAMLSCFKSINKVYDMTYIIDDEPLDSSDWRLIATLAKATGARVFCIYGHDESGFVNALIEVKKHQPNNIGTPICNQQMYILDEFSQSVPIGVKGEIYIGGAGLSTGYRNLDRLSAEYFIPNPFDDGQTRLFKSGYCGRYREDGHIEFMGKYDSQQKLRGFRIGLGDL